MVDYGCQVTFQFNVLISMLHDLLLFLPQYKLEFISFQVAVVLMSMLTNFICDELDEDSGKGGLEEFLIKVLSGTDGLYAFCNSFPQVRFFLAQPNLRMKPSWYSAARPGILRALHTFLRQKPPNLQLLDDYNGDLDNDRIHFSILAGTHYVHSLVDQISELLLKPSPDPTIRYHLSAH